VLRVQHSITIQCRSSEAKRVVITMIQDACARNVQVQLAPPNFCVTISSAFGPLVSLLQEGMIASTVSPLRQYNRTWAAWRSHPARMYVNLWDAPRGRLVVSKAPCACHLDAVKCLSQIDGTNILVRKDRSTRETWKREDHSPRICHVNSQQSTGRTGGRRRGRGKRREEMRTSSKEHAMYVPQTTGHL